MVVRSGVFYGWLMARFSAAELRSRSTADEDRPGGRETGGGGSCDDVLAGATGQARSAAPIHGNGNNKNVGERVYEVKVTEIPSGWY